MQFKELTQQEFDAFAQPHPQGNYLQTSAQAELLNERDWQTALLGEVDDAGDVIAAAVVAWTPVHLGQLFKIDGGMLIDYQDTALVREFIENVVKFAKDRGGLYLEIVPNKILQTFDDQGNALSEPDQIVDRALMPLASEHIAPHQGWTTSESPAWQYTKDFRPIITADDPQKALRDSFGKDGKYYTKKVEQFHITTRRLQRDELPDFKALTQATADRLNYHDKDLDFYYKVYDNFGDDAYFVFSELDFEQLIAEQTQTIQDLSTQIAALDARIAEKPNYKKLKRERNELGEQVKQHEKRIADAKADMAKAGKAKVVLSGALFIATANEMIYLYSGTYDEFKKYYGPYAVQQYAFNRTIERQIPNFNFYGIEGLFDGSDGVLGFKSGFSGTVEEKVGTYIVPVKKTKYQLYRLAKRLLGRS
ncbi:alanine adding enzyme [Weissella uvarum]|uniref:peptidoglycan bridge formation glycyltransferase FemA/FemB family protein n=1 Tax=Weissella uvarum TaxID=1479233 RepID=UPI001962255C|nr:peptidoglycan bridge formation glycyltransferase FemA/FemB family protein [Weissella uvarum]MBM7616562.1 alanine adding enzyme [Weissella uvarum]MCM0594978.1 aminoacyltransferase [Weissella uvarum]